MLSLDREMSSLSASGINLLRSIIHKTGQYSTYETIKDEIVCVVVGALRTYILIINENHKEPEKMTL